LITLAGVSSACALLAFSALAVAQNRPPDVECKKTETQAECHTRLKCKPDEELEVCKKRLRAAAPNAGNAAGRDDANNRGGDRDADNDGRDDDRDDRGDDRRDRDDRGDDRRRRDDRDDDRRGRDDRGDDRRDRDDRGDDRRGRDDGARSRRQRGKGRGRGDRRGFEANKTFGLGLELGEPTGLNGKYFLSDSGALDFGIGAIYGHYYYGDGLHIYGDYLWHPISLVSASAFELPLYIGGGLRFWSFNYCDRQVCDFGGSAIGIRVPIGISFDFNNTPLDIFIQLVPVIDFVSGDYYDRYRDRTHFGIDLSVGIRYWFK
jgi:hypothetical protein